MPEPPTRRKPIRPAQSSSQPEVQIGLVEKIVVLSLLGLGLIVFWLLLTRKPAPRVTTSPRPPTTRPTRSPSPAPTVSVASAPPAAAGNILNAIRSHFREDQPYTAIREVVGLMESSTELTVVDQALVEFEQTMERIDRNVIYQVADEWTKKATSRKAQLVARYLNALIASKTFLYERYRMKKAIDEFEQLAGDKTFHLAALALNKKAMLQVSLNPTEAVATFLRQIREFPECPLNGFASLMIGTCYRALEQDERALAQYQETLEKYKTAYGEGGLPLEPFVRHALADTMIKLGNKDGARKELSAIVASFKDYPYLNVIEETLQSLPSKG